jgi:hypothetical protein
LVIYPPFHLFLGTSRSFRPISFRVFFPADTSCGRKPKWLTDLLKSGRNLDDFRVSQASGEEAPKPEGVEAKPVTGEGKDETKEVKTEWRL